MAEIPSEQNGDVAEPAGEDESDLSLVAYAVPGVPGLELEPAPAARVWMDQSLEQHAYRCLPMLIANQSGWIIRTSHRVIAIWNGGETKNDVHIIYHPDTPSFPLARTMFGQGILTWTIPYVFRTPPGYNLLARGPANWPKDGASPLEGIVETDWTDSSFTMNWKLTRAKHAVVFEAGEPICMIVPQRRGEMERFLPEIQPISADPGLEGGFSQWGRSREQFRVDVAIPGSEAERQGWQRHYFQGKSVGGRQAGEHQTRRHLRPFHRPDARERPDSREQAPNNE